jgi:hypothetical protein
MTPDRIPRPEISFPFTPNRIADAVIQDLIGKLALPSKVQVPPETGVRKGRSKKKIEVPMEGVAAWKEGGGLRTEWLKRDRRVLPPMSHFRTNVQVFFSYWNILCTQVGKAEQR